MWPWGHLGFGYLLYRLGRRDRPEQAPALALAIGTQLPDLIDKPFAWTIPLLPNGRSLGHSLVIWVPILLGLVALTDGRRRRIAIALAVGHLSHLAADALYPALEGQWYYVGFLGWPIVPPVKYAHESTGILEHFLTFQLTPYSSFELLLFALAALLWVRDGTPGLALVVRAVRNAIERVREHTPVGS